MAAKRAKPPSGSKPQKREAKLKSPESRRDEEAALGDQARMILIFVLLFTVAFIAVVGLRLHKEHGELVAEAELNFARAAAFDFHAGNVSQAPPWMQRVGLEWLFRFTREPFRLWKRYLLLNPLYLLLLARQLMATKLLGLKQEPSSP